MTILKRLRRRLLAIDPASVTQSLRDGAMRSPDAFVALDRAVRSFVLGYNAAVDAPEPPAVAEAIGVVDLAYRGFAFEGAGMAMGLLDHLIPGRGVRLRRLASAHPEHGYMIHAGLGWAAARLPLPLDVFTAGADPLLRWLIVDGYGFHHGYFHPQRYLTVARPPRLRGYANRAFDQGLGRSLWFAAGADPDRVARTIAGFPVERREDLWSGIGVAAAYAGGCDESVVEALAGASCQPSFAQGVAFAATARAVAGTPLAHTSRTCEQVWRATTGTVVALVESIRSDIDPRQANAYETWRGRLRAAFLATSAARHVIASA